MAQIRNKLIPVLLAAFTGTAAAQGSPYYFPTPDDHCRNLMQSSAVTRFPGNRGFIQDSDRIGCEITLNTDGSIAKLRAARSLRDLKQAKTFVNNVQDAKHDLRVLQAQGKAPPETTPDMSPASRHVTTVTVRPAHTSSFPHYYDNFRQFISTIPEQNFTKLGFAFATNGSQGFEAGKALNNQILLLDIFAMLSPVERKKFYDLQDRARMDEARAIQQETPREHASTKNEDYSPLVRLPPREIKGREDQLGSARYKLEQGREERRAARQQGQAHYAP